MDTYDETPRTYSIHEILSGMIRVVLCIFILQIFLDVFVNNITYDEANPEYIDKKEYQIDSEEQDIIESSKDLEFTTKLISLDCIKYVKQINENNQDIWNKHFSLRCLLS